MRLIGRLAKAVRRGFVIAGLDQAIAVAGPVLPAILRPRTESYPQPSMRRATRKGISYDLDLSDYVQWLVYYGVEDDQRGKLLALVQPGSTVIDVGTNIGNVLLNFAQLAGPQGQAIGFEANPATLRHCQSNIALNRFANVRVEGIGLGESEGTLSFGRAAATNSGADRFMPDGTGGLMVPVITLDSYVDQHDLTRIDLIKIDVEGFEFKVLRGAEQSIARFRPRLFIELCHDNLAEQGDSAAGLLRWLEERDYAVHEALSGGPLASTDRLDGVFADIVCTPRG